MFIIHMPYFTAVQLVLQKLTNTSYSLFCQKRFTVRHVLRIIALCREQGGD